MQSQDSADDQISRIYYRLNQGQIRSHKYFGRPIEILADMTLKDEAQSGRLAGRENYQKLLDGIRKKTFEIVIVDDLSRLTRSLGSLIGLYEMLKWYEVELISICDGISSEDPSAKTFFTVKGMVNDFSNDIHAERVIRGMEMRALQGLSCGDYPYGYDSTPTKLENAKGKPQPSHYKIAINEYEAQIVKRIFSMYCLGVGYSRIAQALNHDKVPSPSASYRKKGKITFWGVRSVQAILQNEKYIGIWRWKKTKFGINPETKSRAAKERPSTDWVSHNGKNEIREDLRVIDQATWSIVQKKLSENKSFPSEYKSNKRWANKKDILPEHMFSGLLECGICYTNLSLVSGKRGGYYGCTFAHRKGVCTNKSLLALPKIEDHLLKIVYDKLNDSNSIKYAVKGYNQAMLSKKKSMPSRIKEIDLELSTLDEELQNLINVIISGNSSDSINYAIKEREQKKVRLKSEKSILARSEQKFTFITESEISERLNFLKENIQENTMKCYPVIRAMFPKKISVNTKAFPGHKNTHFVVSGEVFFNELLGKNFEFEMSTNKKGEAKKLPLYFFPNPGRVSDNPRFGMLSNGVTDGARTHDNQNHNLALYQLNYGHHIIEIE